MKPQWIDIFFGDRFHRKFKYEIDTLFSTWMEDLMNYTLDTFPYLRRRKEFDLWFNLPNEKKPIRMNVRLKRIMKKIKQFDLDFIHESGNYKLEGCKTLPTLEQFEGTIDSLEGLGCGKFKKIIIDNVIFE